MRLRAQANSIQVAMSVTQIKAVSLVEDAKFLFLKQIGRPLSGFWSASSMMFIIEEIPITASFRRPGKQVARFTAD